MATTRKLLPRAGKSKRTIRRMQPLARKAAKMVRELKSIETRLLNLAAELDALERRAHADARTLTEQAERARAMMGLTPGCDQRPASGGNAANDAGRPADLCVLSPDGQHDWLTMLDGKTSICNHCRQVTLPNLTR